MRRGLPKTFHAPSRLKGIETLTILRLSCEKALESFHAPSRLKGIETQLESEHSSAPSYTFHAPSRLKGIETWTGGDALLPSWLPPFHAPSRLKGIETTLRPVIVE